jgi:hypothetical protein
LSELKTSNETHRRAALRRREALARDRLTGAIWVARFYALLFAAVAILPTLRNGTGGLLQSALVIALAGALFGASTLLRDGSRWAAIGLLLAFVAIQVAAMLASGPPVWHNLVVSVFVLAALLNGTLGAFQLAAIRTEAATLGGVAVSSRDTDESS